MICKLCSSNFPLTVVVDGVEHNLQRRKFCLKCSPFGAHNTRSLVTDDSGVVRVRGVNYSNHGAHICNRCSREYVYEPRQGHQLTLCNSCVANRQRTRVKQKCVSYKGGRCQKCGYNRCLNVLGFHHRNPNEKDFSIADKRTWSWAKLKKELDKCDLLCANCHGEVHDKNAPVV